ncbi:MAG: DUF1127 domain-containing protein [Marinibacterium sp.]|nr:DUF1127 domain-containing protein [Marinibacterium sp.]
MAHATETLSTRTGVVPLFSDLRRRYATFRVYQKTLSEMRALSDRELADLGLHRSMLRRIALQAVYGDYAA